MPDGRWSLTAVHGHTASWQREHEFHSAFNEQLAALPPYGRSGRIEQGARPLELSAAGEIEKWWSSSRSIRRRLLGSRTTMLDYFAQFESLAKTDHLYTFEEIYKIYEQDKELTHPVYSTVAGHYQFVLDHWSETALRYEEIYRESEEQWAQTWTEE
jgi:hypothetical protein